MERLRGFEHANVIQSPMRAFDTEWSSWLPLERCSHDMITELEHREECRLDADDTFSYFRQMVAGLLHCHRRGVSHLDVKPDNMLLSAGTVKLADFGCSVLSPLFAPVACHAPPFPCLTFSEGGTAYYKAPEALQCAEAQRRNREHAGEQMEVVAYDAHKADVWSLGISIVACATGATPWESADLLDERYRRWADAYDHAKNHPAELVGLLSTLRDDTTLEAICHTGLASVIIRMLAPQPVARITLTEVWEWTITEKRCELVCTETP